jgi:hypothetical protein
LGKLFKVNNGGEMNRRINQTLGKKGDLLYVCLRLDQVPQRFWPKTQLKKGENMFWSVLDDISVILNIAKSS